MRLMEVVIIDSKQVGQSITMNVKVHYLPRFRLRVWVARMLLKLACWVLPCQYQEEMIHDMDQ